MGSRLLAALLLAIPASASSHPHVTVQQQGLLSLSRTRAVLTYRIMSSTRDGAHMFDHLDINRDDRLSRQEQIAFANELRAATVLTVDGTRPQLRLASLAFPSRATMSSGAGVIEVRVLTELALAPARRHHVSLQVTHDRFAPRWFLQPFYFRDLARAGSPPDLRRRARSTAIDIFISRS